MSRAASLRDRFAAECGGAFFLDPAALADIERRLHELGWFTDDRVLSAARIGDGNMNLTVRVTLGRRSIILKQARPWVEKYPSIPAPAGRAAVEAAFYGAVLSEPAVSGRMPAFLGADLASNLIVLEDVPEAFDLTTLYSGGRLTGPDLDELVEYLTVLHGIQPEPDSREVFRNREMRALNHAHQYAIPLDAASGLSLDRFTPGLDALAAGLRSDAPYCHRVAELGKLYLADGETLLHGDFFPGSWLRTPLGLSVIDPEFCFLGPREYDLGILWAHLIFTGHDALVPGLRERYAAVVDWQLAGAFAGAELMRRLIGVAQLPLGEDLSRKRVWLELSRRLVCG